MNISKRKLADKILAARNLAYCEGLKEGQDKMRAAMLKDTSDRVQAAKIQVMEALAKALDAVAHVASEWGPR